MKLKANDEGHGTGGAMKKLKKKLKAETKIAEAHAHIDEMKDSKKKLKKKQKADEKREAAEKRKDDAEKLKDAEEHGDDGAVSFLQDAEDDAVLADADSEHGGNGKKKLKKKIKVLEIKK